MAVVFTGRVRHCVPERGTFSSPFGRRLRLLPTAANKQPALAVHAPAPSGSGRIPFAVKVFTVEGDLITGIVGFVTPHLFPAFGMPERLLDPAAPGSA